jgi:hypothetical protein
MRRDVEFAEEYGEGVQTVDRVRKTKVGQNVHQGDSSSVHASPTGAQLYTNDTDLLMWWKQHCVGLVQTDLRGSLLDTTMIDLMWAKQAP